MFNFTNSLLKSLSLKNRGIIFMFSGTIKKRQRYDNYAKEQVIAVAEWFVQAIQQEIPRVNKIRELNNSTKSIIEDELRQNIFVYGDNKDVAFTKFTDTQKSTFMKVFVDAVWEICEYDSLQNMAEYLRICFTPGEGCPEAQEALHKALEAAGISRKPLENMYIGCYINKDGTVDAYVKVGFYERSFNKQIYTHEKSLQNKK